MQKDNLITKYVKVRSCRSNDNTVNVAVLKKGQQKNDFIFPEGFGYLGTVLS